MKQTTIELFQQGDVLLHKIKKIPTEAESTNKYVNAKGENVLAEGESTGHYHGMSSATTALLELDEEVFLHVEKDTEITHQEHNKFVVPAGDYLVGIVEEYDHFAEEARRVQD
jgi:hypothetical protein